MNKSSSGLFTRLPRNVWVFVGLLALSLVWYARVLPPDRFFVGYDLEAAGYADRVFMAKGFREGKVFFWNPDVLGGMPTFAGMMLEFFYPSRILWLVMDVDQVIKWDFVIHTALATFFFYLLLSALGVRTALALAGGIAAGFGWIPSMAYAGHYTKVYVYTWFPLLLLVLFQGVQTLRFRFFLFAAGIMGLMLWVQHLQMAYYAYMASALWVVGWALASYGVRWNRLVRVGASFLFAVFMGVWIGVASWLPGLLYVRHWSIRSSLHRGLEFASSWSASWQDVLSVWIPKFSGLSVGRDTYWGENPFRHDLAYGGLVALLGLVVGVVLWRRKALRDLRAPLLLLGAELLLFLLIVVGNRTPAFALFYAIFPYFKVLRAHSMALAYVAAFATLLGTLLLDRGVKVLSFPARDLWWGVGILGILGLWAVASPSGFGHVLASVFGVASERIPAVVASSPTIGKALLFMALALGLVQVGGPPWIWCLPLLVTGEMFVLTRPFVQPAPAMGLRLQEDPVVQTVRQVMNQKSQPGRVLPLGYRTGESNWEVWGLATAGGMFPFMPRTYAEWIGSESFVLNLLSFRNFYLRPELADLTGVSVVVAPALPDSAGLERYRDHPQYPLLLSLSRFLSRFERVSRIPTRQGGLDVFLNPHTEGLFRFYSRIRVVPPDSSGLRQILAAPEDLHDVLFLSDPRAAERSGDAVEEPGSLQVRTFEPGRAVVDVQTAEDGYLFFSQNYHPQWKAWVDGKEVPVYRAFHTFQAVPVTQGEHTVEFRYVPQIEKRAWLAGLMGLMVWLGLLLPGMIGLQKRRGQETP